MFLRPTTSIEPHADTTSVATKSSPSEVTTWDGSLIGTIKHKEIGKDGNYWSFTLNEATYHVTARIDRASLYCILDESLADFGFAKLGTRRLLIGKTSYSCVNFDFRLGQPLIVGPGTPLTLRERVQTYILLRWAFSLPVDAKKSLFFFEGKLHGKFDEVETTDEGQPREEWFPLTLLEARKKLLHGRDLEKIMRNVTLRIERINRQAFPYLSIIRDRLSTLTD